jgi:hypothetical protein
MTAHVQFFNAESGFATARHVLTTPAFDAESQAAAAELLMQSADARDRDLVQLHNRRMAEARLSAAKPRPRGFDWELWLTEGARFVALVGFVGLVFALFLSRGGM